MFLLKTRRYDLCLLIENMDKITSKVSKSEQSSAADYD